MAKMRTDATDAIQAEIDDGATVIDLAKYDGCEVGTVNIAQRTKLSILARRPATIYAKRDTSRSQGLFHLRQTQDTPIRFDHFQCRGRGNLTVDFQDTVRHFLNQSIYGTDTHPDVPGIRRQDTTGVTFRNGGVNSMAVRVMKARQSFVHHCRFVDHEGLPHGHTDTENESIQEIVTEHLILENVGAPGASSRRPNMDGVVKAIPPVIRYSSIRGTIGGRWKTHAHNRVEIDDVDLEAMPSNEWPGFDMPPELIGAGVEIRNSTFRGFKHAIRTEAGNQYYGNPLVLENITAIDCDYLCSQSHRVKVSASGSMVGVNLRKGIFSDPDSVGGCWEPHELQVFSSGGNIAT